MSMASFTQLGEMLLIVAENTHSRRLLYNACLVSRMFNMAFTPSLYRCLRWDASNAHFLHDESKLDLIIRSGRLSYTRIIIVSLPAVVSIEDAWEGRFPRGDQEGVSWWCGLLDDIYDRVNRALISLFAAARRLRSFACSQLALSRECIRTLSGLPDLRSLYYRFPFAHDFYLGLDADGTILTGASYAARVRNYGTPPDDVNCKGLTRLSLIDMCGELDVWKRWLVRVISESPQLKRLSLSIERQTIERLGLWSDVRVDDIECHSNIVQYISRELGTPLNLECLRLGDGLEFPAPDAICATKLAEAYISNRMHDMVDPDAPINRLALKDLTALSKLAFHDMNYPSMKSISQEASHTLASLRVDVSHLGRVTPFEMLRRLDNRRIPKIMCPGPSYPEDGRWPHLTPLEGCDWITDLAFEWMGIRKGSQTFPDSGTSGFRRICKSLRRLPALKNLWIISSGPVVDDASVFATMSAKAQKSLRYVRVGSSAWRIRRDWNSDAVVLEALDAWEDEVEGPEFFHVPAPLPNCTMMSHVDWED